MYSRSELLAAVASIVGFRDDGTSLYTGLATPLKTSNSGYYVNDLALVTLEAINSIKPENQALSAYLTASIQAGTLEVVDRMVNRSKTLLNSKELLSNKPIVNGAANYQYRVTQNKRFVGYWITPHQSNNLKTEIKQIGFQSTEAQDTLKIYLYVTGQLEPLKTFDFAITSERSLIWQNVTDWILWYESSLGPGQHYLIGYYEKDPDNPQDYQLQGQALYKEFDCGCSNSPSKDYGKYMGIRPIAIANQHLNWNEDENDYYIPLVDNLYNHLDANSNGLNVKLNVTCDITKVLKDNILMLGKAIQTATAWKILRDCHASNRVNKIADARKEDFNSYASKYESDLVGYTNEGGVRVKGIIDTLALDFSSLDHHCAPCEPGITYGRLIR